MDQVVAVRCFPVVGKPRAHRDFDVLQRGPDLGVDLWCIPPVAPGRVRPKNRLCIPGQPLERVRPDPFHHLLMAPRRQPAQLLEAGGQITTLIRGSPLQKFKKHQKPWLRHIGYHRLLHGLPVTPTVVSRHLQHRITPQGIKPRQFTFDGTARMIPGAVHAQDRAVSGGFHKISGVLGHVDQPHGGRLGDFPKRQRMFGQPLKPVQRVSQVHRGHSLGFGPLNAILAGCSRRNWQPLIAGQAQRPGITRLAPRHHHHQYIL